MRKNRGNKKKKLLGRFNRVMYLLLSVQMILISVLPMLPPVSAAEVEGEKVEAKKNDNGNSKSFVTTESTSSTQTQTFTIPGLKKLNGSTVNTGNVEVLSVVGEEVTVRLKDGVRSRQEQTGGTYTPESTQTESDTRTNTTGSFPVNITKNNITLSKDGSATSVQTGGSYDPGGTKSNWHGNGYGLLGYTHFEVGECGNYTGCINWQFRGNTPNNTVYFIDPDGYSGNLVIQKWYWSNYSSFFEELYKIPEVSLGQKTSFPNYGNYFAPYGTLTKPAKDTRTYNYTQKYKGTKIIPATDTRTYQDYYQYEVMFDYEGDTTPPTIGLTANPTALTNQDVTISADIKDVENTTLKTDEGTNSTHTQTFKIPHMKKMDKVTVDTGTVEVVSVDGGQVTVKMKDGVPIRREVTGGSYTPPDTRFVTNQSASYYNSGGYTGNLTAYQTSEVQEYVSHILSGYNVHVSSGWSGVITNFEFPETYRYNTGGVVGYIPISKIVSGNWYTFETNIYRQDVTVTYAGMATRLSATRYQGNVTKPATDTRTYTDTYQYAITFDYEKDVPVQKWAMGNHPVSYFSDSGNVFTGKSFKVMDSGTYTVFARDLVGNESVKLIAISNIDKVAPVITLTPNISLPTNKNIIVTANIADDSSISEKKWAVGSHDATYFASSGTTLGASFEVSENGTFTVYAKDAAGNISVQVIKITNIDRLAPVISLTASPTTLTATDVTITADIRDLDNELFKTPESTSITQTHTFTIPGLKLLSEAKANTGNVEIVSVDGEMVTAKIFGGNPSRKVETGGSYTPADTKFVVGQTSISYNSGGYVGTLSQYVASGSYTPLHTKLVTNQPTPNYNSEGYTGYLEPYTETIPINPPETKTVAFYLTGMQCFNHAEEYTDPEGFKGIIYPSDCLYDWNSMTSTTWYKGVVNKTQKTVTAYRGNVTRPTSDTRVYRYQGNVTKPAVDTRTYDDYFNYEISLDYEKDILVQKWTQGNQIVEFFKNAGKELNGTTFTVSENDTYTVYAEDAAGNESIETINISNIDKKPITPILSASPITPTNENVTVEIKYSDNSVVKKYRIDSGVWTDYTVPISIIKNGTVEAKGQNSEGEWSEIGSISLNNIDKTAPDISLSASPTTLTATDVTITADIRDLDNELFKTPESTSTIQTHTFSIPGLKMLNGAKANTGNAEIVNVDGEKVTVKVSGGNPSRKVETGGSYTPEDTKYVEGQTSSSYNSGGYVGNLLQYVYSGSYTPSHSIEVTGQSSSYYNSGGYSGTLSQYYYGPGPSSLRLISSNHGYGQDHSGMSGNGQYFYECNPSNGNPQGGWFCKLYEVIPGEPIYKYRGTVTKPASDNRVYRYQGNVTKPATDTRTYEDRFQYEISLDYERVVPVQKWTKGNQIVEFFKNAGVELNGTTFTVSENDTYTVYAEDTAGNESIETINISNIDKKPITPILSASPITPTNENVTVEIKYSDNSVVKKYRIDSGVWTDYTVPISIIKNGTVEAKGQNSEGEWSEIGSISLNNIDKTAPDISLTASPTTLTATDVTISAYIRDLEKGNFKTPESTSITQTHTFTIPGLKKLNKASVSTGNVEVVNVDGDKVTVNVSGGARTRQEQTGGEYTPADTQYVTEQTAANYDVGGYKGTLTQYVASGEYLSEDTKYIPDHPTPTFDVGGYKGNLTKYLYSGKLTPGSEKSINSFLTPFYSDAQGYSGWLSEWVYYYPFFMTIEEYNSGVKFPNSISMDTILDYAYANEKCSNSNNPLRGIQATKWAGGSPTVYTPGYNWGNSCGGIAYEYFFTNGGHFSTGRTVMSQTYQYSLYSGTVRQPDTDTRIYKYRGDVTRPVTDTRVYKYQGNVTKPAVDTRTYDDLYQYEITLDFEKVVPVQKWAKGEQSKDYFKSNGKSFFESAFKVSENAIYTVYASDVAGNDAVETITIKNIDDIPPTIKLTANPTTPTNQDVTITAEIEDSSDIQVKKWMSGYQNISFFNEGGNEFLDSSFKVSVNGVYTVYAKDEAGNESIQTITITNIDRIPPATPILSASTSGPTNGNVFVTITYPSDASVKHYRINGGAWTLYTSAVPMTDKGIVEARGQDTAGNWSEIGSITISNIDTNAPVIKLTADPTTPTNQDVTIAADIKDNEKRKVNTSESIVSTQIETFTIPGLKKLNGAKADTGNVEIVSVDGEKVTVKTSGGNPSGQKQTGGSYIPEETKFVTGQPSSSYNVDGYKGNLQMYLYSTNNIPGPSKVLVNQYYGEGWATALYTNTTWEPMRITSITQHFSQGPTPYSDAEGYTGTVQITAYPGGDNCYSHNYGVNMQCSIAYSLYASGTVSKPGTVSNVYRYKGNVTKPAEDTRTYTDTYKYEVTFDYEANVPVQKWAKGNQSVEFFKNGGTDLLVPNFKVSENDTYTVYAQDLGGNETVETINIGNIDKIPPTIVLSQTPERPVNVDITIRADITDNVEIAEKKYAAGTRNAEYFATAGEILPGNKFIVTDNGAYTVYARDTAGNETVETITISNIDRVAPGKATFSINPSTPTNQDVLVTIFYPSDAFEKEYKIGENGAWRLYREPVKLVNNNTVFARSKDRAENMSEESSIEVTNIDKTPPTIVLTDAATESHVVITADINDVGSGIDVKKYAAGRRAASYFETEGTILSGNIFNVTENGTYTVYAKDKAGNETVRTIAVIKMPITSPNPNPKPDPIPNPNPGTCVSGPNGNASGGGLSFTGCSPEKINTVTVHTPVVMYARASDDKEHDQRTNPPERSTPANPNKDRHAFILDRPFTVKLPTSGQHLDDGLAPGYGERDFLKYVEEKEVKFPFDVYTETKEGFYPKGTWIKIPKSIEASTFYLPVWVPEGPYTVEYRSIAINAPGAKPQDVPKNNLSEGMQEHHANLNLDYRTPDEVMQHHIAYDTIEVDVVGRLYDFRVTDILDYQWGSVFRKQEGLIEHTGNNYWVGKNAIDGGLRGNEDPFALPIRQGSHPEGYKNVAVKTGYQFKFDMKTKGNMWNVDDAIRITPSFYFVNKDGTGRRPVDIYYHTDAKYFTKIGSEKDLEYREVKLNEPLRNVEQKQLYDTSKFTYRNPDEYGFRSIVDESLESTFIRNFERDYSKRATKTGPYGNQILNWNLRTLIGPDENQVPSGSMVSPKDAKAREQQWYGEYSLPADIYVVDPLLHPDIAGYGVEHRLTKKSPIFLQDGYVIVNFNIETIDNKNTEKPHLQYHKGPLANQWKMEGFKYNFIDPYDRDFKLIDGDVIFYHGDQSSYDDYKSSVTH